MPTTGNYFHLHLVSDSTGETLITVARAVAAQYANVTPVEQDVVVSQLDGDVRLRRLNESTAAEAGANPMSFRNHSELESAAGHLGLVLQPYEVVRIDPA